MYLILRRRHTENFPAEEEEKTRGHYYRGDGGVKMAVTVKMIVVVMIMKVRGMR